MADKKKPDEQMTTLAVGEEDPPVTTLRLGEEDIPITTLAVGEEDLIVTTLALGEEGPPRKVDFAAADFKTCPETGRLLFLEINTGPMFAAFDRVSDRAVTRALADLLSG